MSVKDGDETQWSANSCDGSDMEECEARLYSMVYHTSNSYDDAPTDSQHDTRQQDSMTPCVEDSSHINHISRQESSPNCSMNNLDEKKSNNSTGNQKEFHLSTRNKASRLNGVNKIISTAEMNKSKDLKTASNLRVSPVSQSEKNTSPKKQTANGEVPKTASLYFQNLTKSLNNVQYLQSVQPRPSLEQGIKEKLISRFSSSLKSPSTNLSRSQNGTALSNFTFSDSCQSGDTPGIIPVFRLDDRLFPNIPRNTSKEEFELSNRLFSNKRTGSGLFVDRDRHNHLFNQLPTIPITNNNVLTKKEKRLQKIAKRKEKRSQLKRRNKISKSSSPEVIEPLPAPPGTNVNVLVPALVGRLNAALVQNSSVAQSQESDDNPVAVFDTRHAVPNIPKPDVEEVIDVDLTINTDEIIDLDSDTDSVASIVVLTPPVRSPPPIIAIEASDEETPTNDAKSIHPLLETDHVENSFDFLDSSDETEGLALARTQAFLFSTLISNGGSKESLLDDPFFKDHEERDLEKKCPTKPDVSVLHVPAPSDSPKVAVAKPETKRAEQVSSEVNETNLLVVNLDESSESSESFLSISSRGIKLKLDSLKEDILVVHSGNVMDGMLVDLEINNLVNEASSNAAVADCGPKSEESVVEDDRVDRPSKRKRLETRERRSEKVEPTRPSRWKRGIEKSQHSTHQRSGMGPVVYTKVMGDELIPMEEVRSRNPGHWTREMRRFYNNSWGGENFNVADVQQTMSNDPGLWRVSWEDKRGPVQLEGPFSRSRCFNCLRFGHPAYQCPEPLRLPKCHMCGHIGHKEANCAHRICLQCGRPSNKYSNGCWECQHIPFDLCVRCIWKHDPAKPCFDLRHRPLDASETGPARRHSGGRPSSARTPAEPETEGPDLRLQLEQRRCGRHSDGSAPKRSWEENSEEAAGLGPQYNKRHRSYHEYRRQAPYYKKRGYRESR